MKLTIVKKSRTNNFKDAHVLEKITNLWKNASASLTTHEGNIYGLYYEYESNYKGDYSIAVAIEGDNERSIDIPENQEYKVFPVNTEDEQGIFQTWKSIWEREEKGALQRTYTYDFEKYYPDGQIAIYIAVK
ncbi:GyrI-like domain-containing protein [Shouchella patagoniensis]|uniref:GyrI-like domain-containing protein n=1 Tax=Shouchella patagoniensis TaxID=228576 RepID=UPI0009951CE7|nr:effector binding domain-containing protein [Shouchella patagoniensis]